MKLFVQIIIVLILSSILVSCKKHYPPRLKLVEDTQRTKEEKEPILPNEMLENEGIRFVINHPTGSADISFKMFKASPNRTEVRLRTVKESSDYYVLSRDLTNNSDFILTAEYNSVSTPGAFQLSINGISSLKGPAGLQVSNYLYTTQNAGTTVEFLKIRKGSLKFSFYPL
jgi:hypothetical protein